MENTNKAHKQIRAISKMQKALEMKLKQGLSQLHQITESIAQRRHKESEIKGELVDLADSATAKSLNFYCNSMAYINKKQAELANEQQQLDKLEQEAAQLRLDIFDAKSEQTALQSRRDNIEAVLKRLEKQKSSRAYNQFIATKDWLSDTKESLNVN